jgi:Domain of unknown function (DUF3854)
MKPEIFIPSWKIMGATEETVLEHFHPDHRADFQKSGLNPPIIMAANVHSLCPDKIPKITGIQSALAFPYPGTNFTRIKIFPPLTDAQGHKTKYLQEKGSENHLYFSPHFWERFERLDSKVFIIEGEKKTLRADQEGLCAVGISGVWGWSHKKQPIPDLHLIPWRGREVRIIPDGDWATNPNVKQGALGLCSELIKRGANVRLVDLNLLAAA